MELRVEPATEAHHSELARFSCWNGSSSEPWAQEAEDHIRAWVLNESENVLLFRTEDSQIAAVSGFSQRWIYLPICEPRRQACWHLDVVGVTTELRGAGIGTLVIAETFGEMKALDPDRVLVTAHVHQDNVASMRAAEKVGLTQLVPKDDKYWVLLAELN